MGNYFPSKVFPNEGFGCRRLGPMGLKVTRNERSMQRFGSSCRPSVSSVKHASINYELSRHPNPLGFWSPWKVATLLRGSRLIVSNPEQQPFETITTALFSKSRFLIALLIHRLIAGVSTVHNRPATCSRDFVPAKIGLISRLSCRDFSSSSRKLAFARGWIAR